MLFTCGVVYEVSNESASPSEFNVDLHIDKCPHPDLEEEAKIITIAIGDDTLSPEHIQEGYSRLPDSDGESRYRWPRTIPAREKLRVLMRWVSVKATQDNITWITLLPTSRFELRFETAVDGLTWGVYPMLHGELRLIGPRREQGMNEFLGTKPLLPYQGVHVWWRPQLASASSPDPRSLTASPTR
jgi:hypothetical protein